MPISPPRNRRGRIQAVSRSRKIHDTDAPVGNCRCRTDGIRQGRRGDRSHGCAQAPFRDIDRVPAIAREPAAASWNDVGATGCAVLRKSRLPTTPRPANAFCRFVYACPELSGQARRIIPSSSGDRPPAAGVSRPWAGTLGWQRNLGGRRARHRASIW